MNQSNLQIIAARVRGLGKELFAIANQLDAQAPHLGVNLPRDLFSDLEQPQPDLFSQMGLTTDDTMGRVDDLVASVRPETDIPAEPQRRTWKRVGVQMKDEAIVAAEKVGRKSGWCQRSDIERSLQRRNPERSREDIREAVNAAVKEMRLTCVKYNSYRFYRTADRGLIIASALARLTA